MPVARAAPSALPAARATERRRGARALCSASISPASRTRPSTSCHPARSSDVEVDQRWVALGDGPTAELESVTALTVTEPTPKYALLNRLMAEEDLADYDFVLTTDDDIVLPDGFLDLFLGVQAGLRFDLAQPARTLNSHVDHPIVIQQRGVVARRTLFVEIGPVVSFGRGMTSSSRSTRRTRWAGDSRTCGRPYVHPRQKAELD